MLIGLGVAFILIGFLFCLTIIGAFIGIPLIFVGVALCIAGAFRRKTVIQNVVTVTNAPHQPVPAYIPPHATALPEPEQGRIQASPMQQIQDSARSRTQ